MANVNISQTLPTIQDMINNMNNIGQGLQTLPSNFQLPDYSPQAIMQQTFGDFNNSSTPTMPTFTNQQIANYSQPTQGNLNNSTLPSDLILSPEQPWDYYQALNIIPQQISQAGSEGGSVAGEQGETQAIGQSIQDMMNDYTNPKNYPNLVLMLDNAASQGENALPNYIQSQQNSANFTNNWQTPTTNPASINLSTGQNLQNPILNQYEQSYNAHSQNLGQLQSQFQTNLNQVKTNIQNSLNQLKDPATAQALIMGTSTTYLQNMYNSLSPYMPQSDYNQAVSTLQSAYTNDSQFVKSYNQLFQNYLGLHINLINSMEALQGNAAQYSVPSQYQNEDFSYNSNDNANVMNELMNIMNSEM
jgi:hypothetical protein